MTSVQPLETDRLILRRPNPEDWEPCRDFFMSDRAAGIGGPDTLGAAWRAFAVKLGHWDIHGFGMWTVTVKGDDTGIGSIGGWYPADWPEKEIGWTIWSPAHEGRGIALEATRAAIHHAFHALKWDTAVSYIRDQNSRAIALATHLGALPDPDAKQLRDGTQTYRHPKPKGLP
jgi:RimJ/RimL family protein N-acetyltransferase